MVPQPPGHPSGLPQTSVPGDEQGGGVQTGSGIWQMVPQPPGHPLGSPQTSVPGEEQGGGVHSTMGVGSLAAGSSASAGAPGGGDSSAFIA